MEFTGYCQVEFNAREMTVYRTEQQTRLHDLIQRVNERKGSLMLQVELAQRVTKLALSCQNWESSRDTFVCIVVS